MNQGQYNTQKQREFWMLLGQLKAHSEILQSKLNNNEKNRTKAPRMEEVIREGRNG